MNGKILTVITLLAVLMVVTSSTAQDFGSEELSPEEEAAIKELLTINFTKTMSENETHAVINETLESMGSFMNGMWELLPSEPSGNKTVTVEKGQGNIFILFVMILTLVVGVGIALLALKKIDDRDRHLKSGRQVK